MLVSQWVHNHGVNGRAINYAESIARGIISRLVLVYFIIPERYVRRVKKKDSARLSENVIENIVLKIGLLRCGVHIWTSVHVSLG